MNSSEQIRNAGTYRLILFHIYKYNNENCNTNFVFVVLLAAYTNSEQDDTLLIRLKTFVILILKMSFFVLL